MAALPLSLPTLDKLDALSGPKPSLPLGWPSLDALLPDGGLPRGVVEISSRHALGGPTRIGARAIAAAHAKNARGWCAWIDPEGSLHAPGLARVGVALDRLFVVRPPRADLGRIAVKVARAGAFDVVVVDMDPVRAADAPWPPPFPGGPSHAAERGKTERARRPLPPEVIVRKLALAAEEGEATVILLTDAAEARARSVPWPVALRLELERRPDALSVRVAKDHRGRASLARTWVPIAELRA